MIRIGDSELVLEQGPVSVEVLPRTSEDMAANVYRVRATQEARVRWRTVEVGGAC